MKLIDELICGLWHDWKLFGPEDSSVRTFKCSRCDKITTEHYHQVPWYLKNQKSEEYN